MSADPGSLGNAVHILRICRRMSLQDLETATGVWRPALVNFEKGRRKLPSLTIAKLVRAMGFRICAVQLAQSFDLALSDVEIEVVE